MRADRPTDRAVMLRLLLRADMFPNGSLREAYRELADEERTRATGEVKVRGVGDE